MFRSNVLVLLAVMLCLPAALCQTASAPATADQATSAVTEVKGLTAAALGKAKNLVKRAENIEKIMEEQKDKADRAASAVALAATAAGNDNAEATNIAQKANDEMVKCDKLYKDAKKEAQKAFESIGKLVTRADELIEKARIEIKPATNPPNDYAAVIESASTVKSTTQTLTQEINGASALLSPLIGALVKLKGGARKVQIIKYQANSIFNLLKIQSLLKEAKVYIGNIEQKRDGIDATVQKMETILETSPATSTALKPLCDKAKVELQKSSNNLNDAKKCNESMFWQEAQVKKDIGTLKDETYENKAKQQAYTVEWHTNYTEEKLGKIKEALQSAETSFSSANNLHQQMLDTMPQTKSRLGSELNTENTNVDVPTADVTTPIQSGEAAQPKPPNTDKPKTLNTDKPEITETDKPKTPNTGKPGIPNTDKPNIPNTGKPNILNTDKPKIPNAEKPEITNSELLNNGKLHMMSKNLTKEPLDSENVLSALGAKNDSAMTVVIPLLVTLIVSAVLH